MNFDSNSAIVAVDIGGTKIAAGLVDAAGNVHHRREVPTVADHADAITGRALAVCRSVLEQARTHNATVNTPVNIGGIGISTGGDVDVAGGAIAYATPLLPGWAGLPLRERFEAEFQHEIRHIRIDNDGNCAALAEAMYGAGRGFSHVLTLIVGTGIGAGYVVEGEVLRGASGGALNPGQIRVPGTSHTYEDVIASGPLSRQRGKSIQAIAAEVAAQPALPTDIAAAADQLGHLAAACAAILDPNCIVIAGSILLLGERFLSRAQHAFRQQARPPHQHLPLHPSPLGANAALVGAACLFRLPLR